MKKGIVVFLIFLLLCVPLGSAIGEETTVTVSQYTDQNGDTAYIPSGFTVSDKSDEQTSFPFFLNETVDKLL